MEEIRKDELDELSDADIEAMWEKTFPDKKVSDFTIDMKRAVLEI